MFGLTPDGYYETPYEVTLVFDELDPFAVGVAASALSTGRVCLVGVNADKDLSAIHLVGEYLSPRVVSMVGDLDFSKWFTRGYQTFAVMSVDDSERTSEDTRITYFKPESILEFVPVAAGSYMVIDLLRAVSYPNTELPPFIKPEDPNFFYDGLVNLYGPIGNIVNYEAVMNKIDELSAPLVDTPPADTPPDEASTTALSEEPVDTIAEESTNISEALLPAVDVDTELPRLMPVIKYNDRFPAGIASIVNNIRCSQLVENTILRGSILHDIRLREAMDAIIKFKFETIDRLFTDYTEKDNRSSCVSTNGPKKLFGAITKGGVTSIKVSDISDTSVTAVGKYKVLSGVAQFTNELYSLMPKNIDAMIVYSCKTINGKEQMFTTLCGESSILTDLVKFSDGSIYGTDYINWIDDCVVEMSCNSRPLGTAVETSYDLLK